MATPILIALFPLLSALASNMTSTKNQSLTASQQFESSRLTYASNIESKVLDGALAILQNPPDPKGADAVSKRWAQKVLAAAAEKIEPPAFLSSAPNKGRNVGASKP